MLGLSGYTISGFGEVSNGTPDPITGLEQTVGATAVLQFPVRLRWAVPVAAAR